MKYLKNNQQVPVSIDRADIKVKRNVKLLPNETSKPVEPKPAQSDTHTQLQDVITM